MRFALPTSERARLLSWVETNRLDLWAAHPEWMDVRLHRSLLPEAAALGIPHRVMVDDLQADLETERAQTQVWTTTTTTTNTIILRITKIISIKRWNVLVGWEV